MSNCKIAMTFIMDANYVMPTWVAMRSVIMSKAESTELIIYIIGDRLSLEDKENLAASKYDAVKDAEISGVEIVYVDVDSTVDFCHMIDEDLLKSWSPSTLYKFMICDKLPLDVHKVIYLDGDMLIRQDLTALFENDIEEYYLGAVRDTFYDVLSHEKRMGLSGKYFNTGCLLLNLDKMREDNLSEELIQTKAQHPEFGLADQDTYNDVCRGKVKLLPLKYNFYITSFLMNESMEGFKKYTTCAYGSRHEMLEDIAVIHMIHYRPWKLYMNVKKFNMLLSTRVPSLWEASIAYVFLTWLQYYRNSPYYEWGGVNLRVPEEMQNMLSAKGLMSRTNVGFLKLNIIQDCCEGKIYVSFYLGRLKIITKERIPGESSRIYLFGLGEIKK